MLHTKLEKEYSHVFTLLGPLAHVQFVPHEMAFPFTLMSVEF